MRFFVGKLGRNWAEGGYTVVVPSLPGCVTYGDTIEESITMAKEAIELYIESLKEHMTMLLSYNGLQSTLTNRKVFKEFLSSNNYYHS